MLEFKIIEILKPNNVILGVINGYTYKVKKGTIKQLLLTNLQVIELTKYQITYATVITILEYKVNEIFNKPFYIKKVIQYARNHR